MTPGADEEAALARSGVNALLPVVIRVTVQIFVLSSLPNEPFVLAVAYGLVAVIPNIHNWRAARGAG